MLLALKLKYFPVTYIHTSTCHPCILIEMLLRANKFGVIAEVA